MKYTLLAILIVVSLNCFSQKSPTAKDTNLVVFYHKQLKNEDTLLRAFRERLIDLDDALFHISDFGEFTNLEIREPLPNKSLHIDSNGRAGDDLLAYYKTSWDTSFSFNKAFADLRRYTYYFSKYIERQIDIISFFIEYGWATKKDIEEARVFIKILGTFEIYRP